MTDYDSTYGYAYHTYPIHSQDTFYEGAFKRFSPMPGPKEVYDMALMGIPKILPMTNEAITIEFAESYLNSALTEIEMEMSLDLSEVTHLQSHDYIDGMFTSNYGGMLLPRWPATKIIQIRLVYPHTNTQSRYQTYSIPPAWIYLKRNKVNIVASFGAIGITNSSPDAATAAGLFSYITGFSRGAWQPGVVEIVYTAGFSHDKLPSHVADLVKTWAAHRMLTDLLPVMFPAGSVNVAIDGVSQSVGYSVQQLIANRLGALEKKKDELKRALRRGFGNEIGFSVVGA